MNEESKILELRDRAIKVLKGKIDDFALGGGTALALVYFQHRDSYDLDFFTKNFSPERIEEVAAGLAKDMQLKIKRIAQTGAKSEVKIFVYQLEGGLKIDFIEDAFRKFETNTQFENISILSKESIYLRKLYAMTGIKSFSSETGEIVAVGGRQEAKDFYDLFFLSHVFLPLSEFAAHFCTPSEIERIIIWHHRYDRFRMKTGLLDLHSHQNIDSRLIEKHFDIEIQKLIEKSL